MNICVLIEEVKEGVSQFSIGALGDADAATVRAPSAYVVLHLSDDRAGWILCLGHEFLERILVLEVDHGSQAGQAVPSPRVEPVAAVVAVVGPGLIEPTAGGRVPRRGERR